MGNPTYIVILFALVSFSFILQKIQNIIIFINWQHKLAYFALIFIVGTVWDYFSVWQQIWAFPLHGTLGIRIGILPLEELLFFLVAPYFGLVTFKFLEKVFKK